MTPRLFHLILPLVAIIVLGWLTPLIASAAATPVAGGVVVIEAEERPRESNPSGRQELRLAGSIEDPAPLDPAVARDVNSAFMTRQVFRGLTRFDENLEPVPELAQRIEISADGLTYRIQLRDDARFADGSPITAQDVAFSLTRALSPQTAADAGAALAGPSYLGDIVGADEVIRGEASELAGLRVVDDRTVEIDLKAPRATFLMKLASAPAAIVDPDDVARGGEWWRDPNASGPYVVDVWEPDSELQFYANENYVGGVPDLRRVSFRLGPNAANPFNLYQADEIDVAGVPIQAIDRVSDEASPLRQELDISPVLSTTYIAFRTDVAPMDDPEIRRAVQLAFPRWKVAEILLGGRQETANGLIPPGTLGRDWPHTAPAQDLEAARAAIAKSSYGSAENVPPITIYGASPFGSEALRDVLQRELGLTVEVLDVDWPQFNQGLSKKTFPAYELTWVADFPDPETFLWNLFASTSPDNYSEYTNRTYDELLAQAAATLDVDERAALYAEAEAVLLSDNVVLPLSHDVRYTLMKPWVKGLDITPLGMLYLENAWLER
ncbi:MAG: 4-phytase [Thermomicrobiales bacterium]|jgi:peptide/nickel transport system substrate-binding protein/oligopeptide transport system substrate-binding protein|nr:4-phytase [Thermomicrobiales bacterium]